MEREPDHQWRASDAPEILPSGDVVLREPQEGWLHRSYATAPGQSVVVRGAYPRTARMHPSTAIAVAPADRVIPLEWPISKVSSAVGRAPCFIARRVSNTFLFATPSSLSCLRYPHPRNRL